MTTSAASSIAIFLWDCQYFTYIVYNIATVGWQLVHYTVYGTKKSDNGRGEAESIIAFLRPVNCIVDSPPSNICIIFNITRYSIPYHIQYHMISNTISYLIPHGIRYYKLFNTIYSIPFISDQYTMMLNMTRY